MAALDRNGYAPSIMQDDLTVCFLCGASGRKLDRHEPFGGANRQKSKAHGMWCMLCHEPCHLSIVHREAEENNRLKVKAQRLAMEKYGWTKDDFIRKYGKNYVED